MKIKIKNIINENNEHINVIHWYPSKLYKTPHEALNNQRISSNVFDKNIANIWCVPYGFDKKLDSMWCTGEDKKYYARDIGLILSTPITNLSQYVMGKKTKFNLKSAISLCKDYDNGLVINNLNDVNIQKILLGQWINGKLNIDEIDQEFFKNE